MSWVDELRTLRVRTNADTPEDARRAREFGAEGIGLCRTEHMFFRDDRILAVREMIVATDLEGRRRALLKLLPMQREDFAEIFRVMDGLPVTIRLLDPPLHEFLPQTQAEVVALADRLDVPQRTPAPSHRSGDGSKSHAGTSRVPAGDHVSGNHRDAGGGPV